MGSHARRLPASQHCARAYRRPVATHAIWTGRHCLRLAFALLLATAIAVRGATFLWDGGHAALDNWSLLQNWNPNDAPANDGTADLVFSGTVRLSPNANGTWDVNSITFNSFAGAFAVAGDAVTVRGTSVATALANDSSYAVSLANQLTLGSSQTWAANTADLSITGPIVLGGNTLTLSGASNFAASGAIAGTGGITKTGTGTAILTGANTYSGLTTVSGGTLQGSTASLPGNIVNHAGLVFDQTTNGTYAGIISGSGSLTKQNTGAVTLSSAQTYTGTTTVSGGSLVLGTADALPTGTAISIASGATLQLAGGAQTLASIAGAGSIVLGSHALTTGGSNASTEFSGTLSGTGGLVKTGTGTLTLSGANPGWTGSTTISAGTLQGTASSLQGSIANSGAIVFDQAANGTFAGSISGAGTFTKQNSGTLTLTGTNAYTGPTAITGGTLALGTANALSDTTAVTVAGGGTLALTASDETIGSLAGAGAVTLGAYTLTAGGTGDSTTFSGALTGTGGKLVKAGGGTLVLSGANSHTGGTDVSGGVLQGSTSSLPGNIALSNNSSVVFDQSVNGTYSGVISGSGSMTKANTGTVVVSGASTYTGATNVTGGTLALGASNALPAGTTLSLGAGTTLDLAGHSVRIGTFNYTTAVVDFGATAANSLLFTGGGAGSGTLTINNFDAATDRLAFASGSTLGASYLNGIYFYGIGAGTLGTTGVTIGSYGGTWDLIVPSAIAFRTWDGGGGGNTNWGQKNNWDANTDLVGGTNLKVEFAAAGGSAANVDTSFTLNALRFTSDAAAFNLTASGGSSLTFAGAVPSIIHLAANAQTIAVPLNLSSTTVVETTGAGTLTLSGVLSGASGGINKVGAGTLVLAGANTYDGDTTINAGTVIARNSTALGSTAGGTTVGAGATLQLDSTTGIAMGAEALALSGTLRNTAGTNSYDGAIAGSGGVTVDGGALSLGGATANSYTGVTAVNSGSLALAKSAGVTALAGNLTIGNGAGTATVTLQAGNQMADTSAVTLHAAGTPVFNLNGHAETIGSISSSNAAATVQLGAGSLTTGGDNSSTSYAGVVSGSGGLIKQGTGTFTLSGGNTYTGTTTVQAGTVVVSHSGALGDTAGGTVVNSGATLQLQGGIAIGAEALALGGSLVNASGTNSYGGAISGSGSVTVAGGSLALGGTGANTYTGTTTVDTGTLDLNKSAGTTAVAGNLVIGGAGAATVRLLASNQIADTSAVSLAGGSPVLNLNGQAETIGSLSSANSAAAVQLGAGSLTTGGDNTSTTFAGVVSGTGGSLTKAGSGTMTLTGPNTYTGATTVSGGKLVLGLSDALSNASSLVLGANTTLSLNGTSSQQLASLAYTTATIDFGTTGTVNHLLLGGIGSTSGLLTISNWTSGSDLFGIAVNPGTPAFLAFLDNVYFSGINVGVGAVISSTPTSVAGYGSFYTLTPIPTFTWSGGQNTGVAADMDNWSKGNNWVGGIAPGIAAVKSLVMAGSVQATNDMDGAYQIKGMVFRSDAGAFTINSSTGDTLTIGGAGVLNQSANTQTLNVPIALSSSQTWTAASGNLLINGATVLNSSHTLTIAGPSHTTINAVIGSGTGGLVKEGTGTLTLNGTNTFSGGVTINAGTIAVTTDANLGASSGGLTFGGGTLRTGAAVSSSRSVSLNASGGTIDTNGFNSSLGGAINGTGGLTKTGAGTLVLTGSNSYSGGTTVSGGTLQGNTTSLQGNIVNQTTLVFDQPANGTYAGVISGSGALTKQNAGVLTLTGANTYTGATVVSGGTLALGLSGALSSTTALTIASGATFDTNGLTQTIGSLAGAGHVAIGSGWLAVGANNNSTTFGGQLSGSGVFEKTGTGTLTFNASINFSGELKLTGGTLALAGINLTLGTLRISGNTILDFGNSTASVLTATNVIVENGAILTINNWVELQDFFYATGALFGLNTTTMVTTPATPNVRGLPPQNQIAFNGYTNSTTVWQSYDWQITPAPEPSTYGLLFVGAAVTFVTVRRWRRRMRGGKHEIAAASPTA